MPSKRRPILPHPENIADQATKDYLVQLSRWLEYFSDDFYTFIFNKYDILQVGGNELITFNPAQQAITHYLGYAPKYFIPLYQNKTAAAATLREYSAATATTIYLESTVVGAEFKVMII